MNNTSLANIEEVTKSYNLGNKSFETDLSNAAIVDLSTSKLLVAAFANMEEHNVKWFEACNHPK